MMGIETGVDVLRRALAWFAEHPESYYPHATATNGVIGVDPGDPTAVRWSLLGAIERFARLPLSWTRSRVGRQLPVHEAYDWLNVALRTGGGLPWKGAMVHDWERAPSSRGGPMRAVGDVIEMIECAIGLALEADWQDFSRNVYTSCNESMDPCPLGSEFEMLWGSAPLVARYRPGEQAWWQDRARAR